MGEATANAAKENPDSKFAIVDFAYEETIPNVLGLIYNTDEAAFLGFRLSCRRCIKNRYSRNVWGH